MRYWETDLIWLVFCPKLVEFEPRLEEVQIPQILDDAALDLLALLWVVIQCFLESCEVQFISHLLNFGDDARDVLEFLHAVVGLHVLFHGTLEVELLVGFQWERDIEHLLNI